LIGFTTGNDKQNFQKEELKDKEFLDIKGQLLSQKEQKMKFNSLDK